MIVLCLAIFLAWVAPGLALIWLFAPGQSSSAHDTFQWEIAVLGSSKSEEFLADQWDRQIEADILAGRLNAAGDQADKDFEAGRCTPLP